MRPQDPELTDLLAKFTLVRLVDFKGVDMSQFQFDYDLTLAILMQDPVTGETYSRFGTQDWRVTEDHMSVAGLKRAMREVLTRHARQPADRRPPVDPLARRTLSDIPAFTASRMASSECYHCHFASQMQVRLKQLDGAFTKEALFFYPLPENIGVTLDVDRNNVIAAVIPASPAAQAGVRAGDAIVTAQGQTVHTAADLQFALNDVSSPGKVTLLVERAGTRLPPLTLTLPAEWRHTDISWRPSQDGVSPQIGIWGGNLNAEERAKLGLPADGLAMKVTFMFPGDEWAPTRGGLRLGDIIVDVDGARWPLLTTRQFHARYRLSHAIGETATLTVVRNGTRMQLEVPCVEVIPP